MSARVLHWLGGTLDGSERVWSAVAPVLALLVYVALAGVLYGTRRLVRGPFRDEEMDGRGQGGLTTAGLRHFFAWTMRPWWTLLARVRFPPNAITSLSVVIALGAGVGVAAGRFALGGWLFVAAAALDFLDGRVARTTGRATLGGAALDSILDRYVESALIVGLAWYYRSDWVLAACLFALTGSLLVPYVRARGEALGVVMKDVGFMQRPERLLVLGAGTALSPVVEVLLAPNDPHPPHRLAIGALVLLALTSHGTAIQRLVSLLGALDKRETHQSVAVPLKSVASNVIATALDFSVATALFVVIRSYPGSVTAAGCVAGALASFSLSRLWTFESKGPVLPEVGRYAFVSLGTACLNAGGVALLTNVGLPFFLAWVVVRAVVFAAWSFPLQRDFVFVKPEPSSSDQRARSSARKAVGVFPTARLNAEKK
jgi:phosphatidylglycerophosphate synthase/putative flippase GtrA